MIQGAGRHSGPISAGHNGASAAPATSDDGKVVPFKLPRDHLLLCVKRGQDDAHANVFFPDGWVLGLTRDVKREPSGEVQRQLKAVNASEDAVTFTRDKFRLRARYIAIPMSPDGLCKALKVAARSERGAQEWYLTWGLPDSPIEKGILCSHFAAAVVNEATGHEVCGDSLNALLSSAERIATAKIVPKGQPIELPPETPVKLPRASL